MTQDQFYYCLERILELREKIKATYDVRRQAQAAESAMAEEQQVDFNSLQRFVNSKENAYKNTAEAQALIKELAAQEAKIRAFVPVSVYGTRIGVTQPGQPPLHVLVDTDQIYIKKTSKP
jgi:ATPase subunit of ABC transporter with duplicated ATPase domains